MSFKLQVYNAVIGAKVLYGLESAELGTEARRKLDVFQLKGLRAIIKFHLQKFHKCGSNPEGMTR